MSRSLKETRELLSDHDEMLYATILAGLLASGHYTHDVDGNGVGELGATLHEDDDEEKPTAPHDAMMLYETVKRYRAYSEASKALRDSKKVS